MSANLTVEQRAAIEAFLTRVGEAEGSQGITSIVETGYRGVVPDSVLGAFDGDDAHARGHIRAEAYDIYSREDFER